MDKKKIYEELILLAASFGQKPDVQRISIYVEDLSEFDYDAVVLAIRTARKNFKFFPQLAEIIELVKNPGQSSLEMATMIASEIIECIGRFGSHDVNGVKNHLGIEKYGIVERSGGWKNLCSITNSEIPSTRAQLRELAQAYINRSKLENKGGPLVIDISPIKTQLQKAQFGGLIETGNK